MANNNDQHEGYIEIPLSDYIVIRETAIHKKFTLYWSFFCLIGTSIFIYLSFYTAFWSIVAQQAWQVLIMQYWYVTLPTFGVIGLIGHFWNKNRKLKLQTLKERQLRHKQLQEFLDGGETPK